jgi:3',5'-cyclic AMP phosphodiesterase CpdA
MNILHLSDLHIGKSTESEELADRIHNTSIENNGIMRPTVVVVTGDIFNAHDFSSPDYAEVINNAIKFFKCLSENFEIADFNEHLFFIPGNHELNRASVKANESEKQFDRYREFLAKIYEANWDNLKDTIYNNKELCFVKHFQNDKVIIVGLNSSRYEVLKKNSTPKNSEPNSTDTEHIETSRIGSTQIKRVHELIRKINEYESNRVIVCLHNNIYNTIERNETDNVDFTCVQNNDDLISFLNLYNCNLLLHGHKHQLKNRRINLTQDIKKKDKLCTVISGGTLKGLSTDAFNYIKIFDAESAVDFECIEFSDDSGMFTISNQFYIPVLEDARRYSTIQDAIQSDPQLSSDYKKLKDSDTDYDSKLSDVLDSTLCAFKEISDNFFLDQASGINMLYVVLGAMHYWSNKTTHGNFINQSEDFIRKAIDKISLSDTVFKMLNSKDAYILSLEYEECKKSTNTRDKTTLTFLALTIYLSDFFLTVKRNPIGFYNKYIKEKASYILNESDIKAEISGNTISFVVDVEHRSLRITVQCFTANSHKAMSLIVKEFELILSKFEEDFASIGFRVYYVLPKIMKSGADDDKLESYEFGAYIPRLIPLLAGNNIYSEPEAFTRELIQNSIDAIKVRAKREGKEISELGKIKLEINKGTDTTPGYFRISDEGTGMNRYVLERYLTTIGRSFYTSSDFDKLNVEYSPISQFGIGFLSCFMLGKHVEVRTTHYDNTGEVFSLDIPNYDGCFFIESKKEGEHKTGSCITVWENMELRESSGYMFDIKRIKEYIKAVILDIPFDITNNDHLFVRKYKLRNELEKSTKINKLMFFIPLESYPDESGKTIVQKSPDETTNNYSEHGIYFYKRDNELFSEPKRTVMNNGILVRDSRTVDEELFDEGLYYINPYLDVAFNLPSHSLELDVSRDKIKSLKGFDKTFIEKLLTKKISKYLENDEAKSLKYTIWCLMDFESHDLSHINVIMKNKILIIKYGNHKLSDEVKYFSDIMGRFDECVFAKGNTASDQTKDLITFQERYQRHYRYDFEELLMRYSTEMFRENSNEEIFDHLQNRMLFHNFYTHSKYDANELTKQTKKFPSNKHITDCIGFWLLEIMGSRHSNKRFTNRFKSEFSLDKQSIVVLAGLKFMLSMLLSYEELEKGIEIPLDGSGFYFLQTQSNS